MTAVAGTTDTETLSHQGSSCILELSDGRITRLTDGLEASCSTDEEDGRGGWKMAWRTNARKRRILPVDWFYEE